MARKERKEREGPATYGTVGAHFSTGSMSRTGREGTKGSSYRDTMDAIEEED